MPQREFALVGRTLAVKARFVKDTGNAAAHGKPISAAQAAGDDAGDDVVLRRAATYRENH